MAKQAAQFVQEHEPPLVVYGRLLEGFHISGYAFERAYAELEFMLQESRWVATGFETVNDFVRSIDLSKFKHSVEQRQRFAKLLEAAEVSQRATAQMLGVGRTTVQRDLEDGPNGPSTEPQDTEAKADDQAPGPNGSSPEWWQRDIDPATLVQSKAKRDAKQEANDALTKVPVELPEGVFSTIVIDPPWPMEKIERDVRPNQFAFDYPTMTIEELIAYGDTVGVRAADDCHLFMFTTQKFLPAALGIIEAWDFRYVLTMVWHKPGGYQPFGLPQYNCEFIVYARKGSPKFLETTDFNVCFNAPRREHSRKPDEFYALIRRVTDEGRCDWFSRGGHEGFVPVGNEVGKFDDDEDEGVALA